MALKNPQTSNVGGVQIHVDSAYDNIKLVADNITELLALETYFKEHQNFRSPGLLLHLELQE